MSNNSFKSLTAKSSTGLFTSAKREKGLMGSFVELTKPRLSMMAVASAVFGYFSAAPERNPVLFMCLLIGTALTAAGAAALNQWMEVHEDSLMQRTADRPIPTGELSSMQALSMGLMISLVGLLVLAMGTNIWTMLLTLGVLFSYLAIYTPLKKHSPLATEAGAISGALPPLLGYVAATGSIFAANQYGWLLFAILFAWQMPHFMAISWMHRVDYRIAGFKMLAHQNNGAAKVARKSLFYSLLLVGLTFAPAFTTTADKPSIWFLCLNGLLSVYLLFHAVRFLANQERDVHAKSLFYATILHLPAFMIIFALDRLL